MLYLPENAAAEEMLHQVYEDFSRRFEKSLVIHIFDWLMDIPSLMPYESLFRGFF